MPRSVFSTIDIGRPRTLPDLLGIKGYKHSAKLSGATRLINMLSHNKEVSRGMIKSRINFSIDELFAVIQAKPSLPDDIEYVMTNLLVLVKRIGAPLTIALFHCFKEKDKALALEFLGKLNDGDMLDKNSVIYKCFNIILNYSKDIGYKRYTSNSYLLYVIIKTWNCLRDGFWDERLIIDHSLPIPVIK